MRLKKLAAGLLALAVVCSGIVITPGKAEAAAPTEVLWGDEYYGTVNEVFASKPECEKEGYVFAGWYDYDGEMGKPVTSATDDGELVNGVCSKWIPASWLTVKTQNASGTTETTAATSMRLTFAVDTLDYQAVGFDVLLNNDSNKALTEEESRTTRVYSSLIANNVTYTATQLYGEGAEYLAVLKLTDIEKDNYSKIVFVRPYVITLDGTKSSGTPKYVHVEDGYKKLVSVPVTVKSAADIAAGVGEISFDNSKLDFYGFEAGRIFDKEMEAAANGGKVKFVGNIENIANNVANADDIYVNLRFSIKEGTDVSKLYNNLTFDVTPKSADFCNNNEEAVMVSIPDVRY